MLGYFETKNIGRKRERAPAFHEMGDATSEIDMEFDWADETLHAGVRPPLAAPAAGGARSGPGVVAVRARGVRAARPGARRTGDLQTISSGSACAPTTS
jgi:hypothetical protein